MASSQQQQQQQQQQEQPGAVLAELKEFSMVPQLLAVASHATTEGGVKRQKLDVAASAPAAAAASAPASASAVRDVPPAVGAAGGGA